jgi:hypothetical protein
VVMVVVMVMMAAVMPSVVSRRHVRVLHGREGRARADEQRQDERDYDSEFLHRFFSLSFSGISRCCVSTREGPPSVSSPATTART